MNSRVIRNSWLIAMMIGLCFVTYGSSYLYTRSDDFPIFNMTLGLLWYLSIFVAYLALPRLYPFLAKVRLSYTNVFVIAFLLRFLGAAFVIRGANYDIEGFQNAANLLRSGQDIYLNPHGWPYPPLAAYIALVMDSFVSVIGLPFSVVIKLPFMIADSFVAILVFTIAKRSQGRERLTWEYILNPIAIWIAAYHGQFDSIAMLFIIGCLWICSVSGQLVWRWAGAGSLLGLAVAVKTWPFLLLPFFVQRISHLVCRIAFVLGTVGALFIVIATYVIMTPTPNWMAILGYMGYKAGPYLWGYLGLLEFLQTVTGIDGMFSLVELLSRMALLPVLITLGVMLVIMRKHRFSSVLVSVIAAVYATSSMMAAQYLVWIVPLAVLDAEVGRLRTYSLLAGAFVALDFGHNMFGILYRLVGHSSVVDLARVSLILVWIFSAYWALAGILRSSEPDNTALSNRSTGSIT